MVSLIKFGYYGLLHFDTGLAQVENRWIQRNDFQFALKCPMFEWNKLITADKVSFPSLWVLRDCMFTKKKKNAYIFFRMQPVKYHVNGRRWLVNILTRIFVHIPRWILILNELLYIPRTDIYKYVILCKIKTRTMWS